MKFSLLEWVAVFACCGQASYCRRLHKKTVLHALHSKDTHEQVPNPVEGDIGDVPLATDSAATASLLPLVATDGALGTRTRQLQLNSTQAVKGQHRNANKQHHIRESKHDKDQLSSTELRVSDNDVGKPNKNNSDKHDKQPSVLSALLEFPSQGLHSLGQLKEQHNEGLGSLTQIAGIGCFCFLLGCSCACMLVRDKLFGKKDGVGERRRSRDSMGHARSCKETGMDARTAALLQAGGRSTQSIRRCEDIQHAGSIAARHASMPAACHRQSQLLGGSAFEIARVKRFVHLESLKKQAIDLGDLDEARRLNLTIQAMQEEPVTVMSKGNTDGTPIDQQTPSSKPRFLFSLKQKIQEDSSVAEKSHHSNDPDSSSADDDDDDGNNDVTQASRQRLTTVASFISSEHMREGA